MKEQYIIGDPQKDFIRIIDYLNGYHFSLNIKDINNIKEYYYDNKKSFKIYKLVEIK